MPTPVAYILSRISPRYCGVDVYSNVSYASYQVYVDNALVAETAETSFAAPVVKNQKVDVLGLTLGEAGIDFSDTLSDANGDKIEFDLPESFEGKNVKVYSDGGDGTIDFGKAIAEGTAETVVTVTVLGYGDDPLDDLALLPLDALADLPLNTETGAPRLKLVVTKRLASGTYRFALVNYNAADNYHSPYIVTKIIATRPDELDPYLVDYDATTDDLLVSAGADQISGTYSVYAAPWDDGKDAIDFTTPIATSTSSPLLLNGIRGATTSGTRYLSVRKSAGAVEEQNFNILTFTVVGGEWVGNIPAAPTRLTTSVLPSNAIRLRWEYTVDGVAPDGFKVYSGTSAVDYGTVVATVAYRGGGIVSTDLPVITQTTHYSVRAYRGSAIETNTATVNASPVSPSASTFAAPTRLTASILAADKVRLKWEYIVSGQVPDGFKVYSDSGTGTINYVTPVATVAYVGHGILTTELPTISTTTKFAVRAYRGGNVETNTEYTSVVPLVLPVIVTGTGTATWKDN